MKLIRNFFKDITPIDLVIMKKGLTVCFFISLISIFILITYLSLKNTNLFLYNLGITLFKLSCYLSVEFIICGIAADIALKQK